MRFGYFLFVERVIPISLRFLSQNLITAGEHNDD